MMGLWIRSQDGNKLFNIHELYIRERTQPKVISVETKLSKFEILGNDEIIASYNSQERALEVLDDIQKKINDIHKDYLLCCMREKGSYEVIAFEDFTYEMPEE